VADFGKLGEKPKNVLVVAAHPDDEVIGCGGTIARHADTGDRIQVLIVAEGATSRHKKRNRNIAADELKSLIKATHNAAEILGVQEVEFLSLPDNRLDSLDRLDLIKCLEEHFDRYKPEIIYVHHSGDVNVDHRRIHEAVITACRPIPDQTVRKLLSYEVASSTEWQPPLPGKMTPLHRDHFIHQGGLMEQSNASLQRGRQG